MSLIGSSKAKGSCGKSGSRPRLPRRVDPEGRKIARLARDIDDVMFNLDPYGYMDACEEVGLGLPAMRASTRENFRTLLRHRDPTILDGLCNVRKNFEDDPDEKKTLKKLNSLIGRTKKFFGLK